MGEDKSPMRSPFEWAFRACLLMLGAVIALNLAIAFLRPILPWLIAGLVLVASIWITVSIVRWRRSRW